MALFLAGICLKTDTNICPPGSFEVPSVFAASAAFLFLAVLGFVWLGYRGRGR